MPARWSEAADQTILAASWNSEGIDWLGNEFERMPADEKPLMNPASQANRAGTETGLSTSLRIVPKLANNEPFRFFIKRGMEGRHRGFK